MKILLKVMRSNLLITLFFLSSCGFSTSLYQEILEAEALFKNSEYRKSAKLYESILLKNPSKDIELKLFFQLADLYLNYLNELDKAEQKYEKVVKATSNPLFQIKAFEKIAEINFNAKKNYKKSSEIYLKLANFKPQLEKYSFYQKRLAESYYYDGKYKDSLDIFNNCVFRRLSFIDECYYYKGLISFYQKNYEECVDSWIKYISISKNKEKKVFVKYLIANTYESQEELKQAYNIYYSILGEYPNSEIIKKRLKKLYDRRVSRKR